MAGPKTYWGVDSLLPANTTNHVPGGKTLYDFVKSKERAPDFWGRYIVGSKGQVLTKAEVQFLLARKCRILPVFNGISAARIKGGRAVGREHAKAAIAAADGLKIPDYTYIYANIEWDWEPSKEWILGWWDVMYRSRFGGVGGLYCNPAPFNGHLNKPLAAAISEAKRTGMMVNVPYMCPLFSSGPSKGCGANRKTLKYAPFRSPAHPNGSVIWQYAINCHKSGSHGLFDKDLANARGYRTMWPA